MKTTHQLRVESFMSLAGQDVPSKPTIPITAVRALRARLILEEAFETVHALGFDVMVRHLREPLKIEHMEVWGNQPGFSLIDVVDGCCDLRFVTTGTLSAIGVQDEMVQKIVDDANLRKFGPGGYRDKGGKWIKPPDFVGPEPELRKALGL